MCWVISVYFPFLKYYHFPKLEYGTFQYSVTTLPSRMRSSWSINILYSDDYLLKSFLCCLCIEKSDCAIMGNVLMEIHLLNCIIYEETETIPGGTSCISSSTAVSTRKEEKFSLVKKKNTLKWESFYCQKKKCSLI